MIMRVISSLALIAPFRPPPPPVQWWTGETPQSQPACQGQRVSTGLAESGVERGGVSFSTSRAVFCSPGQHSQSAHPHTVLALLARLPQ